LFYATFSASLETLRLWFITIKDKKENSPEEFLLKGDISILQNTDFMLQQHTI